MPLVCCGVRPVAAWLSDGTSVAMSPGVCGEEGQNETTWNIGRAVARARRSVSNERWQTRIVLREDLEVGKPTVATSMRNQRCLPTELHEGTGPLSSSQTLSEHERSFPLVTSR
jgi:hypothetical protein